MLFVGTIGPVSWPLPAAGPDGVVLAPVFCGATAVDAGELQAVTVSSAATATVSAAAPPRTARPPARGIDTWTLAITDTAKAPQKTETLTVLPYMPDHGHGTSIDASITNNGDGTYTVTPLYFFMPGVWQTTFTTATTPPDTAVFYFCVPG